MSDRNSKTDIIEELRRVANALGSNEISQKMYSDIGKIHIGTIRNRFGSWKAALAAAGLSCATPSRSDLPSDEELLQHIVTVTKSIGKTPSANELTAQKRFSQKPYVNRWGSFTKARQEAYSRYGYPLQTLQNKHIIGTKKAIKTTLYQWELINAHVRRVAKHKFEAEFFADAVESALKEVNYRVKVYHKQTTGDERDGAALMRAAFSPNNPSIRLSSMTSENDKSIQQGYMDIFAGAIVAIRNPKAHENITITAHRAFHLLFLASLLMEKLDEAGI